jgi:hypothetical protein
LRNHLSILNWGNSRNTDFAFIWTDWLSLNWLSVFSNQTFNLSMLV